MQLRPNITVVGSINMDLVFRTPRMPGVGETVSGHDAHSVQVVFNPASAIPLSDALLAKVNYLIVKEIEATQLSGVDVHRYQ